MSKILITGGAGFIGSSTSEELLKQGFDLVCFDNFSDYYDVNLKRKNIETVKKVASETGRSYELIEGDIRDKDKVNELFKKYQFDGVIHFAAMAGVRPSIENPSYYFDVNINGLISVLDGMRNNGCSNIVFISSSSVYGNNKKVPFSEKDNVDNPISPYAATKKSGELICYTYHKLFNFNVNCLRYFTVYGPRQRPDLAINKFTRLMLEGKHIPMYGDGTTARDYTFISDIVNGTILALKNVLNSKDEYDIFNLGGSNPISLKELIDLIGKGLNITPMIDELPMQSGDVNITYSDFSHAKEKLNYEPKVRIEEGLAKFITWYKKENNYE